jgi:hypothetical protein
VLDDLGEHLGVADGSWHAPVQRIRVPVHFAEGENLRGGWATGPRPTCRVSSSGSGVPFPP